MRGRNTENNLVEEYREMANSQRKQHVIMRFIHEGKYIVFHDIGKGRRKKEVCDGIEVIIVMN